MVQKPQSDAERKERRIDLSLPQVAGSAVAAVAAAVMASQLGVYGTIAGAGVMSVVATCGGSVFQHFFRRTGEQIREVTVQVKHPAGRQVTVRSRETTPAPRRPEDDPTTLLRAVEPHAESTTVLHAVEPGADPTTVLRRARPGDLDATTLLGQVPRDAGPGGPHSGVPGPKGALPDDAYSDARTHGTRVRGWKRSALAATGVFVLSMAGITVYELASGHDLGGNGGTTVGSVVRGDSGAGATSPEPSSDTGGTGEEGNGDDGGRPDGGEATTPGTDTGDGRSAQPGTTGGDGSTADPTPTPSVSGGATPETTAPATPGEDAPSVAPDPTVTDGAPAQEDGAAGADAER
ncbi:hypothetical protein ABZ802_12435 [Streptomyces sp. NPDC047737]|uniref:hypothetical protein n=1 Tax=Streptomyces sp. NPDC047737 TaxID=3155740 RepID=UPI0033CC2057